MSKGAPRFSIRFPGNLVEEIDQAIDSANLRRAARPYDWTAWVRQAVREKLRSLARGRASSQRRRAARQRPATQEGG